LKYFISNAIRVEILLSKVVLQRISQADPFRPTQLIWETVATIWGKIGSTVCLNYYTKYHRRLRRKYPTWL